VQFADTSILLYAISRDPAEQDKAKRANDILAGCDLALSCPKTWVTARTTPGSGSPIRCLHPPEERVFQQIASAISRVAVMSSDSLGSAKPRSSAGELAA
jgi:hypothetical protein